MRSSVGCWRGPVLLVKKIRPVAVVGSARTDVVDG